MRRKLYKSRRGQISTEIMYAVGVMIMIFLLLTGVSFNRRSELRKMDDYLQKRNECLKIANTVSSLTAAGFNTRAVLRVYNKVWIYPNGRIVIDPSLTGTKETPCNYVGNMDMIGIDTPYVELPGGHEYCFFNTNEKIDVFEDTRLAPSDPFECFKLCTDDDPLLSARLLFCS